MQAWMCVSVCALCIHKDMSLWRYQQNTCDNHHIDSSLVRCFDFVLSYLFMGNFTWNNLNVIMEI